MVKNRPLFRRWATFGLLWLRQNRGFTLGETAVSLGIVSVTVLVAISVLTLIVQHFQVMVAQNEAEQNLMQAAYYLRAFGAQAVKTRCSQVNSAANVPSAISNSSWPRPLAIYPNVAGVPDDLRYAPEVPAGVMDCRFNSADPAIMASVMSPLALFVREGGGGGLAAPASNYLATGFFFEPPKVVGNKATSGVLYLAQNFLGPGNNLVVDRSSLFFDKLVEVRVSNVHPQMSPVFPSTPLQSLTITLTARYFKSNNGIHDYRPVGQLNAALVAPFRDITMSVNVGLRDNWLGMSQTGTATSERQNGGVYYYGFWTPLTKVQ